MRRASTNSTATCPSLDAAARGGAARTAARTSAERRRVAARARAPRTSTSSIAAQALRIAGRARLGGPALVAGGASRWECAS